MGLFDKILSKSKTKAVTEMIEEPADVANDSSFDIVVEDFPLAPVELDEDENITTETPKKNINRKTPQKPKKEPEKKPSALQLSTKKLLKLQNELKSLTVMQVEKFDGDIIPEGVITGKFEIERAIDSKRRIFNLLSTSGSIIGSSRPYSSVSAAMNGINSVISNAKIASIEDQTLKKVEILPFPKWVVYLDNNERFNFILYASNGNPVIHSHGYTTKQSCKKGIESVIGACKNPMIEKTYLHNKE
jgi:uncharacterized protein YegP (UPF0339 family)